MADAESRINLNIDADQAIATIKNLQSQISTFHQSLLSSGNAANAAISQNLQRNLVNSINATRNFSASLQTVKSSAESFTESLERNRLSMGQYFRYSMASTKTFGRSFKNELATIDKVARERVKTLQTQYIKLGRDANGAIQTIAVRPLKLDMENLATQMQMNIQKQQIFNQVLKQGSTNLLNFGKNTQWAGRQLMVGFTIPLSIMGGAAIKSFQEMEEQVIKFKRVYGELNTTVAETENMAKSIKQLATEFTKYGIAVEKTMGLAADAAAMGKMGVDLLDQVTEATRLSVLGGVEQQQALETTISLTNAFGIATEQLAGSIDFLNSVENQTVVSIEDLTTAIPKAGPVVQQLGGDVKDLAFFLTAMKEGGINASEGANALKSGLASLINPTKQSSDMLAGFGINVRGIVEANKGDLKGTIISFANALDQLDPLNRAQAIEQLFGKFQFARISTLFQNVIAEGSQASRVLELSRASAEELAILSERELKRVEDSPAYKFQKSIEDIKTQLIPLGQEFIKLITPIIEFGSAILKQFNNLDDGLKTFITGAIGVLGLLAPVALMTIGLFANGIANLIKGFGLLKNFMLMISGASSGVSASTEYMTQQQLEAAAVAASLSQSHATLTQVFSSEASALYNLISAYQAATAAQNSYNSSTAVARTGRNTGLVDPSGNPLKLANGIFSVPGPKGAGDIVPAMLSPGEAVIPADKAQKYGGLIKGIIAGNIPGFAGGYAKNINGRRVEETHVAAALPKTTAVISEVEKLVPGFSKLNSSVQNAFTILGDLTATKTRELNQQAKGYGRPVGDSTAGRAMTGDEFLSEWNVTKGTGFDRAAERAGIVTLQNGMPGTAQGGAGVPEALVELDTEVGNRVAARIDAMPETEKAVEGWLDRLMEQVTQEVISEFAQEAGTAKAEVASALASRASTPGGLRTARVQNLTNPDTGKPYGDANSYFQDQKARGNLEEREGLVGLWAPGTNLKVSRPNKTGGQRTNSIAASVLGPGVAGGTFEYPSGKGNTVGPIKEVQDEFLKPIGDAKNDADQYANTLATELEAKSQDPYMYARDRNSPHPLSGPDGADDARNYQQNFEANLGTGKNNIGGPALPGPPPIPGFEQSPASQIADSVDTPAAKRDLKGAASSIIGNLASGIKDKGKAKAKELGEKALMPLAKIVSKGTGNILVSEYQKENVEYDSDTGVTTNAATGEVISTEAPGSVAMAYDKDGNAILNPDGTPMTGEAYKKLEKQAKAQKRVSRAGKVAGAAGFIAMGAGMAGGMIGGEVGNFMTTWVAPIAGAVAMIAPILLSLAAPVAIAVGALALLVGGFILYHKELEKITSEARQLGEAMSSGANAMQRFADAAGTVTASEIMDRRRSGLGDQVVRVSGKTSFGVSFFEGESGKDLLNEFNSAVAMLGKSSAIDGLKNQLITAVASGILSADQAEDIALELGNQINDYGVSVDITAELVDLFGPNGEKLLEGDPLKISTDLAERSVDRFATSIQSAADALQGDGGWLRTFLGFDEDAIAAYAGGALKGFVEEQQSAIDVFEVSSQKRIDALNEEAKALQEQGKDASEVYAKIDTERQKFLEGRQSIIDDFSGNLAQALDSVAGVTLSEDTLNRLRQQAEDIIDTQNQMAMPGEQLVGQDRRDAVEAEFRKLRGQELANSMPVYSEFVKALKAGFEDLPDDVKKAYEGAIDSISGMDIPLSAKVMLSSSIAEGDLNAEMMGRLFEIFQEQMGSGNPELYFEAIGDITLRGGAGAAKQLDSILSAVATYGESDEDIANTSAYILDTLGGLEGIDLTRTLEQLQLMSTYSSLMGGIDPMTNILGMSDEARKQLFASFDEMQKLIDRSIEPITVESVIEQKIITDTNAISAFRENQDYFNKLDPVQQYLYVQTFLSVIGSVSEDEAIASLIGKGVAGDLGTKDVTKLLRRKSSIIVKEQQYSAQQIAEEQARIAAGISESVTKVAGAFGTIGDAVDDATGTGSGSKEDPFAFILKDLQNLRDASIDAAGGVKELMRLFEGTNDITIFDGIDQQLTRLGFNADFVNYLTGLDKEMQDLFFTVSNGKIVFTETGIAMKDAFDQKILGAFQATQVRTITDIKNQNSALVKLTEAGIELAQAYELVQDAALAAAIANGKMSDDEWKELVDTINEATEATKRFAAAQDLVNSNAEFGDLQEINQWILDNQDVLSGELINEILNNSALQQFILAGPDLSQEERDVLEEFLQNFLNQEADLSLDVKKLTIEGMEEIFNDGFNKAMEAFAAEEKAIELEFEMRLADDNKLVTDAENQIAAINFEIDDLEAQLVGIEDQEEKINEAYDDKLKALEEIKSANEDIARQAKSQLTIADALSRGDISAAAAAAQELRSQNAQARIENQQKLLEKSRELELARITAANGKTRKQIEEEIKKLKDEIFQIEENTLEPAQERIRLAEIEKQQRIDAITVLGKTKLEWELIKNGIDLAKTRSDIYADAMQAALDIVKDIEDYWNGLNRTVTTVHQIINRVTNETPPPTPAPTPEPEVGSGSPTSGGPSSGGPSSDPDPIPDTTPYYLKAENYNKFATRIRNVQGASYGLYTAIGAGNLKSAFDTALKNYQNAATPADKNALKPKVKTAYDALNNALKSVGFASGGIAKGYRMGGLLPYKAEGGSIFKPLGTDTIPAMLSPGEFVVRKFAVDNFGVDRLKAINSGTYSGESVYNYSVNVNVKSDSNPDQIARAVMTQIKQIDSQRIRSNRF